MEGYTLSMAQKSSVMYVRKERFSLQGEASQIFSTETFSGESIREKISGNGTGTNPTFPTSPT